MRAAEPHNLPQMFDGVIEVATETAMRWVAACVEAFAPGGVPFGREKKSEREQLREYVQLRGNPMAWSIWLQENIQWAMQRAQTLTPEEQAVARPYETAIQFAIDWSTRMEAALTRERGRFEEKSATPRLSASPEER